MAEVLEDQEIVLDFRELNKRRNLLEKYIHESHSGAVVVTNPGKKNNMVTVKFDGSGYRELLSQIVTDMQSFGISTKDMTPYDQGVSLVWPEKVVSLGFVEEARETPFEPLGLKNGKGGKESVVKTETSSIKKNPALLAKLTESELQDKKKELEELCSKRFGGLVPFDLLGVNVKDQHTFATFKTEKDLNAVVAFLEEEGISYNSMMPDTMALQIMLATVGEAAEPVEVSSNEDESASTSNAPELTGNEGAELTEVPELTRSHKVQIGKKLKAKLDEAELSFEHTVPGKDNDKGMIFKSKDDGVRAKEILKEAGIITFGKVREGNESTVKIFDLGEVAFLIGLSVPLKKKPKKSKKGKSGSKGGSAKAQKSRSGSPNGTSLTSGRLSKEDQRPIKKAVNGWIDEKGIAWKHSADPRADYVLSFNSSDDAEVVKELLKEKGVSEFGRTRKDYVVRIIDLSELAHHAGVSVSPKPASNTASTPSSQASKSSSLSDQEKIQMGHIIRGWLVDAGLNYKAIYDQSVDKALHFESTGDADAAKKLFRDKGVTKEFGNTRKDTIVKIVDLSELKHHLTSASSGSPSSTPTSSVSSAPPAPAPSVNPVDSGKLAEEIMKELHKEGIVISKVSVDTSKNKIKMKTELMKESKIQSILKKVIENH